MGLLEDISDAIGERSAEQAGPALASREALEAQAHEQNRILASGQKGTALIKRHEDTGAQVAGNPIWIFELEVTPVGGEPYVVRHREIISSVAMGSYADGNSMPCRIDPADPEQIAFGDKPFI